ncbi:MMPL family transporter [Thalassoglobus sp. JC818]|uniref:efflux RND transporter permease subunit n=1 Tax=Thalassoglobus sp. JC818 TaxID=3232136 RepID=UPI00345956EB
MDERLIRGSWILLAIAFVVTAVLYVPSTQLQYDQTIESLYDPSDPLLVSYLRNKEAFGGDEFLIVGFPVDDPTSSETLEDIRQLADELSAVPGIRSESTQDLEATLRNDRASGLLRVAMRLRAVEESILDLSRRVLVSDDDHTVSIILRLEDASTATVSRGETFRQVREIAANHSPETVVAGEPLQIFETFQYVEQDAWVLGYASFILLSLVILFLFRSLRWVILPLIIMEVVLIWTKGMTALTGIDLSIVSSIVPSLVTIIVIATTMHVTLVYRRYLLEFDREKAFRLTEQHLARPIFWTCVTTAVGFFSLFSSSIVPVRSFAVLMATASLLIPIVCVLILPGGMLLGRGQYTPESPPEETRMVAALTQIAHWANRHAKGLFTAVILVAVFSGIGLTRLNVETDFSKNFRSNSSIVQAIEFFETRMGGVGTWEITFTAPNELDDELLDKVRDLTAELKEMVSDDESGLTKVISLTDGLDLVPKIRVSSGREGGVFSVIPRFRTPTLEERQELLDSLQPEMTPSLYRADLGQMRILLRAREQQSAEVKLKLIEEVEEVARQYFPDARASGLYVLLANLIKSLLNDQLLSFVIAALGITGTIAFALRSIKLGLISTIPNMFPILVVIGAMGWLDVPVNIGTAMIASVSIGLTVDATIHYIFTYQRQRRSGHDHETSVVKAHTEVGLAMVLATLALVVGFSVLILSNFVPLADFGILVSVAMAGGLLCNLFLLPSLLKIFVADPVTTQDEEAVSEAVESVA